MAREVWTEDVEAALARFASARTGLSSATAADRLREHGLNNIPTREERTALHVLVAQLRDWLVIALLVAAVLSYVTDGVVEAIIILMIVGVNVSVGFVQEYKSEKMLQRLIQFIRYRSRLLRDGVVAEVDTREVVPGDVVVLETGDRIPADLRLIVADALEIDESIITGEVYPRAKTVAPIVEVGATPQSVDNMAFTGTLVVRGKGLGLVVATGLATRFGHIVGVLRSETPETNYQRNIRVFSQLLVKVIVAGILFILVMNALTGKALVDSILFSLALAVGLIPEALPIIITIGLSRGALRMSRDGVIVKKLSAIEDLGNMDVFCSDKTGTLTENRIAVETTVDAAGSPDASVVAQAVACISVTELAGVLRGTPSGSPIDVALAEYARTQNLARARTVVGLIPFDHDRRRMSVVVQGTGGALELICKGAPESVLPLCVWARVGGQDVPMASYQRSALALAGRLFGEGKRVVGVAARAMEARSDYSRGDEQGLTLLGFVTFRDPLKASAPQSIRRLAELGVQVKILTGDNPVVTQVVAEEVGLQNATVMVGQETDGMDEAALQAAVEKVTIFARLSPEQKARIIRAITKNGHVVGFLGDGVNDAPALRVADVGVSVDKGVDIAKEAADIILTQESLDAVSRGIVEGRTAFGNTTKYILNTISANLGNMVTLALFSIGLGVLPMLPLQVLLTNLLSDGPLLAISTDRVDPGELDRPVNWNTRLISRFAVFFGGISSVFDFATISLVLLLTGFNVVLFRTCWFIESVLSEILVTFAIRTKHRFYQSTPSTLLSGASIGFGVVALAIPYLLGGVFEFSPPSLPLVLLVFGILAMYFVTVECAKTLFYKAPP